MHIFIEGLKLGFMFQFLIGPICFFLLQIAIKDGFIVALWGSLGVSIGDGIFIILAILGLGKAFDRFPKLRRISSFIGMLVLVGYGLYIIIDTIFLQSSVQDSATSFKNALELVFYGLLITLSNPITILYWSGSFAMILSSYASKNDIIWLGFGAFITTPIFFLFWTGFGAYFGRFIPGEVMYYLHIIIGILLCYYGIKTYLKVRES